MADLRGRVVKAIRNNPMFWRHVSNRAYQQPARADQNAGGGEYCRVLTDLRRDGIAISTADRLFPDAHLYSDLAAAVDADSARDAAVIQAQRSEASGTG